MNMGSTCIKEAPKITMNCTNTGEVSSCCNNAAQSHESINSTEYDESKMDHDMEKIDDCMKNITLNSRHLEKGKKLLYKWKYAIPSSMQTLSYCRKRRAETICKGRMYTDHFECLNEARLKCRAIAREPYRVEVLMKDPNYPGGEFHIVTKEDIPIYTWRCYPTRYADDTITFLPSYTHHHLTGEKTTNIKDGATYSDFHSCTDAGVDAIRKKGIDGPVRLYIYKTEDGDPQSDLFKVVRWTDIKKPLPLEVVN